MKFIFVTYLIYFLSISSVLAQEPAVPRAKTKAEKKAARKKMSLEERIEDSLPVDIGLPSASAKLPGGNKISNVEDAKKFINETLPGYGAKAKKKARKAKKKIEEAKNKIFDGKNYLELPVEKQIYRRGTGSRMTYIEFYTLDTSKEPSHYHRMLTWYDLKRKRIVDAVARDRESNILLHGPFKEFRGEVLIKEGFYYLGQKHGRWVTYDKDFILLDKITYSKGYYADSKITFYDTDSVKIKEVIPKLYGKVTGQYLSYHENGTLALEGFMDDSVKVKKWISYYETGNRRQKETQYPSDKYDKSKSYVIREYDEKGKIIYEHEAQN